MIRPVRFALGALLTVVVVGLAAAQSTPGPAGRALLERIIERRAAFAADLGLNPTQQQTWQALGRQQALAAAATRADLATVVARLKSDLATPNPDLAATAAFVDQTVDGRIAAQRELRASKLAFYEQLDPAQQARVRSQLLERIERLERMRDALLELAIAAQ